MTAQKDWPWQRENERYLFGEVEIDASMRLVHRQGDEVSLTPKQYDLLVALARHRGAAVARSDLMVDVWGSDPRTKSRSIDQHVRELRRKLESLPSSPRYLLTVRKFGYRLRIDQKSSPVVSVHDRSKATPHG